MSPRRPGINHDGVEASWRRNARSTNDRADDVTGSAPEIVPAVALMLLPAAERREYVIERLLNETSRRSSVRAVERIVSDDA